MIDKIFFSDQNKFAIKSVITADIKKEYDIKVINNDDAIINETMTYVIKQAGTSIPNGMTQDKYIFLMNKKVYDIVMPVLKNNYKKKSESNNVNVNVNNNINNNKPNKIKNNDPTNLFDPILMKQFETPNIIEYPKPSEIKYSQDASENKIKNLENERSLITPKLKPIDFTIKNDDFNKVDTTQLYNDLMINYNKQNESTDNSLISQNNPDFPPIEHFSNINQNNAGFTPIESLINQNDVQMNFNNDNNSYTRNQLQTGEFSSVNPQTKNIMLAEPDYKIVEKEYYVIFDSKNRDLYQYPNPTLFQVKFNPAPNNYIFNNFYDQNNTLIIKEKTISYGGGNNDSIGETIDNIKYIKCDSVVIPNMNVNIIYNESTNANIYTNIFKEPFLYLIIQELKGPYTAGNLLSYNAFSKLLINYYDKAYSTNIISGSNVVNLDSGFTLLNNKDSKEIYYYDPVTQGKLDKLTLSLNNQNGNLYNTGIDKLYIESFSEGESIINGYCGESFISTRITIQSTNNEYSKYCSLYNKVGQCNILNNHPILAGDLIYLYNTIPEYDNIVYFEDNIIINKLKFSKKNNTVEIFVGYYLDEFIYVNFKELIPGGITNDYNVFSNYYIVIYNNTTNKTYYLKIVSITNKSIIVTALSGMPQFKDYNNLKIGIAKNNLNGISSDDSKSLFSKQGNYVINVGPNTNNLDLSKWVIDINYPYILLPEYLKTPGLYNPGDIFLIQDKLQVHYTFIIGQNTKDYNSLTSYLNVSGNN